MLFCLNVLKMKYKERWIMKIFKGDVSLNDNLEVYVIYFIVGWYLFEYKKIKIC